MVERKSVIQVALPPEAAVRSDDPVDHVSAPGQSTRPAVCLENSNPGVMMEGRRGYGFR